MFIASNFLEDLINLNLNLSMLSARIEWWLLRLQLYHFHVVYKSGKKTIADRVSRLPHKGEREDFDDTVNFMAVKAVPKAMRATETEEVPLKDTEMEQLRQAIQTGRLEGTECPEYLRVANESCVVDGIDMRGTRMVVHKSLRTTVLNVGHEGHLGTASIEQRLYKKVWWPKLEKDIEKFVKVCDACQLVSRPDPLETLASTELPKGLLLWLGRTQRVTHEVRISKGKVHQGAIRRGLARHMIK